MIPRPYRDPLEDPYMWASGEDGALEPSEMKGRKPKKRKK